MVSQSILKKVFMALTGLGLVGFLIAHLLGNLLLYIGADKFNAYATMMENNMLLVIPAEIGLIGIFAIHLYNGIKLHFENKSARPENYEQRKTLGESTFASRTMIWSGLVILFFLVIHIMMFKFGDEKYGPKGEMQMYELVVNEFKEPPVAIFYVVCMLFMGLHLSHALASAAQTLGLSKPGLRPKLRNIGFFTGWGLSLAFAAFPIWAIFIAPTPPAKPKPLIPLTSSTETSKTDAAATK
jgi:succinate dehydrogenase / fumarate reductase, cytochrome b subunit